MEINELLMSEMKACWQYFRDNTNLDMNSKFFGLTRDKYPLSPDVAGISSTGYGLASLVIGIEQDWISYDEAYSIALGTLNTLLKLENKHGFYHRYIDMNSGERAWNSEISIIDTGILLCGVITAGEYFGCEIKELATKLYNRVNWKWFTDKKKNQFRLGYKGRFYGYWDNYAEQLMLYVLGAGSTTYPVNNSFNRLEKDGIIYSWFGCLFTYQYSHAWIDFKETIWFENSVRATRANMEYCNEYKKYKGYWGLSATITKKRYSQRLGAEPCVDKIQKDGTLSISSALSSIVFLPVETKQMIISLYKKYPEVFGKYGFVTSFNLSGREPWFCEEYLGIDKGTTMIMLANYFDNTIWQHFMNNECVKKGMEIIKREL